MRKAKIFLLIFALLLPVLPVAVNAEDQQVMSGKPLEPVKTEFDQVQVDFAGEFTVTPVSVEGASWFTDIAGGPDKPLKISYGKVKLFKNGLNDPLSREFIKISGENGSEMFLKNSGGTGWYNEDQGTHEKLKYLKTLFWSDQKLEGNTLVKYFSLPIKSVVLKKNFDENQKLVSINLYFSSDGDKAAKQFSSPDDPTVNIYAADLSTLKNNQAETLKSLGLISGTAKGLELDKVFTRAQGAVIVIKLLGQEKIAQGLEPKSVFGDVKNNHWAAKYVTYAYKNGIVHGTAKNKFSPDEQMTGKELMTLILRGIGYKDASPETARVKVVEAGLLDDIEATLLNLKPVVLRDDMTLVVYNALRTKLKGSTKTVLQNLVESNAVPREAAVASGLYSTPQSDGAKPTQDTMGKIEDTIKNSLPK